MIVKCSEPVSAYKPPSRPESSDMMMIETKRHRDRMLLYMSLSLLLATKGEVSVEKSAKDG